LYVGSKTSIFYILMAIKRQFNCNEIENNKKRLLDKIISIFLQSIEIH